MYEAKCSCYLVREGDFEIISEDIARGLLLVTNQENAKFRFLWNIKINVRFLKSVCMALLLSSHTLSLKYKFHRSTGIFFDNKESCVRTNFSLEIMNDSGRWKFLVRVTLDDATFWLLIYYSFFFEWMVNVLGGILCWETSSEGRLVCKLTQHSRA